MVSVSAHVTNGASRRSSLAEDKIQSEVQAACRKLFSRAKGYLMQHRPRFKASPEDHRRLLEQFMRAVGSGIWKD